MSEKYSDDWMTPPKPTAVVREDPEKKPWLIEREYRVQGPITGWREWASFADISARDAAFDKLQNEHPFWSLRKSRYEAWRAFL